MAPPANSGWTKSSAGHRSNCHSDRNAVGPSTSTTSKGPCTTPSASRSYHRFKGKGAGSASAGTSGASTIDTVTCGDAGKAATTDSAHAVSCSIPTTSTSTSAKSAARPTATVLKPGPNSSSRRPGDARVSLTSSATVAGAAANTDHGNPSSTTRTSGTP